MEFPKLPTCINRWYVDEIKKYIDNSFPDENQNLFCYTMKNYNILIIMKKLEDTQTNEERESVRQIMTASHKANKLLVLKLINVRNGEECDNQLDESIYSSTYNYVYKKNKIIGEDNYDINNLIGIYYYKSIEPLIYWFGLRGGTFIEYYINGNKKQQTAYSPNGTKYGYSVIYNENGIPIKEDCYL